MDQNTSDEYKADANAIWAWLKAHPWLFGFICGVIAASVVALIL